VNPKSSNQHDLAKKALHHLLSAYSDKDETDFKYNEIVANVRPEHVAGIFVEIEGFEAACEQHCNGGEADWPALFAEENMVEEPKNS
jgi:hypothetical protein